MEMVFALWNRSMQGGASFLGEEQRSWGGDSTAFSQLSLLGRLCSAPAVLFSSAVLTPMSSSIAMSQLLCLLVGSKHSSLQAVGFGISSVRSLVMADCLPSSFLCLSNKP